MKSYFCNYESYISITRNYFLKRNNFDQWAEGDENQILGGQGAAPYFETINHRSCCIAMRIRLPGKSACKVL